ncbi:MAG: RagB/SusD family nutrient uptake outer membrane protein [Muribaculaceae bacterium]|nr:RagB/SusD family nutrient uptake outer membrane protein [Muribaculaceae bacterium]
MKKIKYSVIALLLLVSSSCSDFLDHYPQDSTTNETFWNTEAQLRASVYPCYEALYKDFLVNWSESTAETVMWGNITSGLSKVSGGKHAYTDGFPFTTYWQQAYGYVYRCNNFLDNYDRCPIAQDKKDVYAGEVKVLRAYLYFLLTTFWGDVPYIDHVITADEAYIERTSRAVVIDNIMEDLKWAASKLPAGRQLGSEVGRIDRWGALALRARIALQNERWDEASKDAAEIIEKGPYGLFNYSDIFHAIGDTETNSANNEAIIYSLYVPDVRMNNLSNETCCPVDYIRLNPTKTLIDAYLCTDGKPAKTGLEYYKKTNVATSPLYTFPEQHYKDYFQNRDPRMAMTLYCPGEKWPGGDDGDTEVRKPNAIFNLPRFATLQQGNNGANGRTGFYLKKYNDFESAGLYNQAHQNLNVIRFAEVLLIWAEAKFEMQGKTLTQDQIDYSINKLRNRVGMHPMLLSELKAWNMDLQTELRRERRIELAAEGMRYADVMRWREGELRFGRAITGPSELVCKHDLGRSPYSDNGVDEFGDVIFEKSTAEGGVRYFDATMHYLWPVPYAERVKNPLLGQNPGWPE